MHFVKPFIITALIGISGLFLVRITGRIVTAHRTDLALQQDFTVAGTRVLVRGTSPANPLLVFVDDDALPTLPYARTIDAPLAADWTTVHYTPSGTLPDGLTDTLRTLFPGIPLYLSGHGTGAAACLAAENTAGLVLINPPYNRTATDAGIFKFALDAAKTQYNKQAMCELITTDAKTGTSRCAEGTVGSKWMDKFGGRYYNGSRIAALQRGLFFNPDLTLADAFRFYRHRSADVPAPAAVPADSITTPVLVVTGTHTPAVWAAPSKGFYAALTAPKHFVTIDSAGYAPHLEQPEEFSRALTRIRRGATLRLTPFAQGRQYSKK